MFLLFVVRIPVGYFASLPESHFGMCLRWFITSPSHSLSEFCYLWKRCWYYNLSVMSIFPILMRKIRNQRVFFQKFCFSEIFFEATIWFFYAISYIFFHNEGRRRQSNVSKREHLADTNSSSAYLICYCIRLYFWSCLLYYWPHQCFPKIMPVWSILKHDIYLQKNLIVCAGLLDHSIENLILIKDDKTMENRFVMTSFWK